MFLFHNKLEEMNSSELVEIRKLDESNVLYGLNFSILEAKLSVRKQVNTLLSSRLISIEHQC